MKCSANRFKSYTPIFIPFQSFSGYADTPGRLLQFFCTHCGHVELTSRAAVVGHAIFSIKYATDSLLLRRGIEVPVPAPLVLSLVPDELVDEPLIDAAAGEREMKL